jgi:phenazine biosynthesis protein phzE
MFKDYPQVNKALLERNNRIAHYWFTEPEVRNRIQPEILGKKVLIIEAEDTFTLMLAQMLKSIGFSVTVRRYDESDLLNGNWDLFVMGPGPGNPSDIDNPKIRKLREIIDVLTENAFPFLAICLSHQILCIQLGLTIRRKTHPNQGKQQIIDIFGVSEVVGFYNTFFARCREQELERLQKKGISVSLDNMSRDVYALKGPLFSSFQFHPESLLTLRGIEIITSSAIDIIKSQ